MKEIYTKLHFVALHACIFFSYAVKKWRIRDFEKWIINSSQFGSQTHTNKMPVEAAANASRLQVFHIFNCSCYRHSKRKYIWCVWISSSSGSMLNKKKDKTERITKSERKRMPCAECACLMASEQATARIKRMNGSDTPTVCICVKLNRKKNESVKLHMRKLNVKFRNENNWREKKKQTNEQRNKLKINASVFPFVRFWSRIFTFILSQFSHPSLFRVSYHFCHETHSYQSKCTSDENPHFTYFLFVVFPVYVLCCAAKQIECANG